jgi:hypothetical protein
MRIVDIYSRMAWGEREATFRSAKWSAAMVVATFAALLIFGSSLSFADQSPGKMPASLDWTQWTTQECDAVLNESNWVTTGDIDFGQLLVQLRSALPVREALLRSLRLKMNYAKMNAKQKQSFDQKHPSDMSEKADDPIRLYVEHDGKNEDVYEGQTDENPSGWRNGHYNPAPPQEAALKLSNGALVMPIKTVALQDDVDKNRFVYWFPRIINGKSAISSNDALITFVFGKNLEGGRRIRPLQNLKKFQATSPWIGPYQISFRTAGLTYNGKLEY